MNIVDRYVYAGVGGWVASGEHDAGAGREESLSAGVYAHCGFGTTWLGNYGGGEMRARVGAPFDFGGVSRGTASVGLYVAFSGPEVIEELLGKLTH